VQGKSFAAVSRRKTVPNLESLFPVFVLGVVAYFGYRFFKHGGLRGAMYGSAVVKTFGDIQLAPRAGATTTLRIHLLADGRLVLEQSSRALLAASFSGIPMAPIDVDRLIVFLQQARTQP
jgi:hypothetical protein